MRFLLFSRNLLSIPHHPLRLSAEHFHENFLGQRAGFNLSLSDFTDITDKLPILLPPSYGRASAYTCSTTGEDAQANPVTLRTSLIPAFQAYEGNRLALDSAVLTCTGSVTRRIGLDREEQPTGHEHCIFTNESETITAESFENTVMDALAWTVVNTKQKVSAAEDGIPDYMKACVQDVKQIQVTYKSKNQFYRVACNQVEGKGPAELKKNLPREKDETLIVGYIGKLRQNDVDDNEQHKNKKLKPDECAVLFCCLNLDSLAQVRYDIPDTRTLWSQDDRFLQQFHGLHASELIHFKPLGLFPPLWRHDISVWENEEKKEEEEGEASEFDTQRFCDIVRDVTSSGGGGYCVMSRVMCVNVWAEPQEGRVSRCHRLLYQASDVAVSHALAHAFQNAVRLTVAKEMGLQLR